MPGRTIIITGASDGIGAAAARRLHRAGEKVVIVGRNPEKTRDVATALGTDFFVADFTELDQVRDLARRLQDRYPRIDVLANNAGGMVSRIETTADGFEKTYQVNYLAPFLLTTMLIEQLVRSRASVVNTSSSGQRLLGRVDLEALQRTGRRGPGFAYALTKLAIILFTKELHRRYHAVGLSTVAFHPGYINSNLMAASEWRSLELVRRLPTMRYAPTVDTGAERLTRFAAADPGRAWRSGEYYSRGRIATPNRSARDAELAAQLWERSLSQIGC